MKPNFPIYIPSKGRADSRLTVKALEAMGVPFFIIVEEQEFQEYAKVIDKKKILILDKMYQETYDPCCDLPPKASRGSGPARNFAWEHALMAGFTHHWIIDDNISYFSRLNNNSKIKCVDGAIFRAMEDFCLRYINIAMAGPNYDFFAKRKQLIPPFITNTKLYSCNLIRNDMPYRWRGRYNEDVDLSIRMLKDGWCTVQFNAFLQKKSRTQTMKGGNTTELYAKGTLEKSQMLVNLHPDVASLVHKFGRDHHHVDYRPFKKNKLILRPGLKLKDTIDNYGMEIKKLG